MTQKAPILLYQEAQSTLVNTINYYISQGVPSYELQAILNLLTRDLAALVEQETKKAQEEYQEQQIEQKSEN